MQTTGTSIKYYSKSGKLKMAKYSVLNNTLDFRRTQSQNDCLPASKFEVELELDEVTP